MGFFTRLIRRPAADTPGAMVEDYIRRLKAGERLDRSDFIADYPAMATDLMEAFKRSDYIAVLHKLEAPLLATDVNITPDTEADQPGEDDGTIEREEYSLVDTTVDEYEIRQEVGRGAMGRVYKAWDKAGQRFVALKTLQSSDEVRYSQLRRLEREADAQARLCHPNIVEVYGTGEHRGIPYILMELVPDGATVQSYLAYHGAYDERDAALLIREVVEGLAYSHKLGVIHRDIKPSNIMLTNNTPKLADFGLAFLRESEADVTRLTKSGETLGTLSYMSPEQARSKAPNPQWDVYSVGATLYEMVTGEPPFLGESAGEVLDKVLNEDPKAFDRFGISISKPLEAICIKCLEKKPGCRYDTALELLDELTRYLEHQPVRAPHINWTLRRFRQLVEKRRLAVIAGAAALLFALCSMWWINNHYYHEQLEKLRNLNGEAPEDGPDFNLKFLLKAAQDNNLENQAIALETLCRFDDPRIDELFLEYAKHGDIGIQNFLATQLLQHQIDVAPEVCHILLQNDNETVVLNAINLAYVLKDPQFIPALKTISMSQSKLLRNFAISAILHVMGDRSAAFIDEYLEQGPKEGRILILNKIKRTYINPPVRYIIDFLGSEHATDDECVLAAEVLVFFTGAELGADAGKWRDWWAQHESRWQARTYFAVSWGATNSKLRQGDIIWTHNGAPLTYDTKFDKKDPATQLVILRADKRVDITGPLNRFKAQGHYLGTLDGRPAGSNVHARKLRSNIFESGTGNAAP
jgi:serine/threonine protein kinase